MQDARGGNHKQVQGVAMMVWLKKRRHKGAEREKMIVGSE